MVVLGIVIIGCPIFQNSKPVLVMNNDEVYYCEKTTAIILRNEPVWTFPEIKTNDGYYLALFDTKKVIQGAWKKAQEHIATCTTCQQVNQLNSHLSKRELFDVLYGRYDLTKIYKVRGAGFVARGAIHKHYISDTFIYDDYQSGQGIWGFICPYCGMRYYHYDYYACEKQAVSHVVLHLVSTTPSD